MLNRLNRKKFFGWMLVGILLANVIASCSTRKSNVGAGGANSDSPVTLTLVSYAVTQNYDQS